MIWCSPTANQEPRLAVSELRERDKSQDVVKQAMAENPEAKLWGGVAPELQQLSEVTGCPMCPDGPGLSGVSIV